MQEVDGSKQADAEAETVAAEDKAEFERWRRERAAEEARGLGLFVRSLVGLDHQAAKEAMTGFIADKTLSANQLEFINLVLEHLTAHGTVEPERMYESPFTDLAAQGPDGLFQPTDVDELVRSLDAVRATAVAA